MSFTKFLGYVLCNIRKRKLAPKDQGQLVIKCFSIAGWNARLMTTFTMHREGGIPDLFPCSLPVERYTEPYPQF